MVHDLKIDPDKFAAVLTGAKRFELRKNDRNFAIGDLLTLREFRRGSQTYTGRQVTVEVYWITAGEGVVLRDDHVIMGIGDPLPDKTT